MKKKLYRAVQAIGFGMIVWSALVGIAAAQARKTEAVKVIRVNDPAVDGTFLKPYRNSWKVVYQFPGKEPFLVGTWSDELAFVEIKGRRLLQRTQVADYAKYHIVSTYVNFFDPKTMAPVSMDFKRNDTGEWAHRDFDGARVTFHRGESGDTAKTKAGQLDLPEPVFDYHGGMYGVLLAALPLSDGLELSLPTLSEDRDELERVTLMVGKQELVEAGSGKQVMAWPIETDGNSSNQSHSIFWISKEPPYVIKLVTILPRGKWVTVTMTMI